MAPTVTSLWWTLLVLGGLDLTAGEVRSEVKGQRSQILHLYGPSSYTNKAGPQPSGSVTDSGPQPSGPVKDSGPQPSGSVMDSGCQCVYAKHDCGCCVLLNFPRIGLNDTGCLNVTYLPQDYGVSLLFSLDGVVYFNKTVSARHPPPVCFGIPYLRREASLCLDLYDLDLTNLTFSGCAKVTAELLHVTVGEADLGCFRIPLSKKKLQLFENELAFTQFIEHQKEFVHLINALRAKKINYGRI